RGAARRPSADRPGAAPAEQHRLPPPGRGPGPAVPLGLRPQRPRRLPVPAPGLALRGHCRPLRPRAPPPAARLLLPGMGALGNHGRLSRPGTVTAVRLLSATAAPT